MSSERHWIKIGGKLISAAIIVAAGGLAALVYAHRLPLLHHAADRLAEQGRAEVRANPGAAAWLLTAATKLAPSTAYNHDLANAYLAVDRPADALFELNVPAAGPLIDPTLAKAAAELEIGQLHAASQDAARITAATADPPKLVLAAEIKLAAGDQSLPNTAVATAEALQRIQTAHASSTALAADLYALGLLNSSERVIVHAPIPTTDSFQLLAQIRSARANWSGARQALIDGLKLNPADIALHKALIDTDRHLGNPAEIYHQQQLLDQLRSGKV